MPITAAELTERRNEFFALAMAGVGIRKEKSRPRFARGTGRMLAQSTDVWALRLRSRKALSSQTQEKTIGENLKTKTRKD